MTRRVVYTTTTTTYLPPAYIYTTTPTTYIVGSVYVPPPPVQNVNISGPPLPPGWQAALDTRSNKVYFIDHNTHTTSWNDPRFVSQPQHYQPPPQQSYPQPQQQQQQPPRQPQKDSIYQYGHRFCSSCGMEVTPQATSCHCGKPLRN